ncbi:MAG TPA: M1 family aminopeptidase, partial [Nitrospiraceae bacterium]|nr:M1 family aminopeptidase [Nitrospiraceae bacterium]
GTTGTRSTEKAKSIILSKLTDASGKGISFVHQKHRVWVVPAEPFKLGQDYTLHFSLNEDTIVQLSSVHYLVLNDYPWYPQHGYVGGLSKMDWTIKAKKPLYATGSGRIVKDTTEGAFNVTQLVFDQDVWLPCLIFGQYQKQVDTYKSSDGSGTVALTVFSAPQADFTLTDQDGKYFTVSVTVPGNKPRDVLEEAKQIIKFDESLYGLFPYGALQVAQMSPGLGFGQSPPGFVQLTGEAFMSSERLSNIGSLNPDFFHEFFAHEISHQWWAHEIKWAADEDVWLSESFAEYSAGLYVMQLLGPDRFQGKIKVWKDNAKIADPHAPIAWANNVSGQNAGLWRTGLIYDKGPYVVHMLRMQVGHENFVKAMKNLMVKYHNQEITTDQLKQEFELVVGYKLDYFFDQWFRGTGIPTFDYSSSVKQTEDGKWLATVSISQRDKENVKIVSMPVFFHFGKDKVLSKDRPILKAEDVYQIKLPEKPTSITLDDYHTLLADIVAQGATGQ